MSKLNFDQIKFFTREDKPYGLSYGEWSAKWWQWLLSIPRTTNPAFDSTGQNALINQREQHVFFLCQTYEGVESVPSRKITISRNKGVFLPIINWVSLMEHDGKTDQELLNLARERMDVVANLEIKINGITVREGLEKYRFLSPFFDAHLPEDNIIGIAPGKRRGISDGYWLFLKPQNDEVTLTSFGSCSSGATKIGVDYQIDFV